MDTANLVNQLKEDAKQLDVAFVNANIKAMADVKPIGIINDESPSPTKKKRITTTSSRKKIAVATVNDATISPPLKSTMEKEPSSIDHDDDDGDDEDGDEDEDNEDDDEDGDEDNEDEDEDENEDKNVVLNAKIPSDDKSITSPAIRPSVDEKKKRSGRTDARKRPPPSKDIDDKNPRKKTCGGVVPTAIVRTRKQPGFAMIKTEEERITRALDILTKRKQTREKNNGGKPVISTCGILLNDLISFYTHALTKFERKFAQYISN
jgi:hypothetical protein